MFYENANLYFGMRINTTHLDVSNEIQFFIVELQLTWIIDTGTNEASLTSYFLNLIDSSSMKLSGTLSQVNV